MPEFDYRDRHRMRLPGYDYTQAGTYFITICVAHKQCVFGEIADGTVHLTAAGQIVQKAWEDLPRRYAGSQTDEFIVMPNHVHGLLYLPGGDLGGSGGVALGTVVRAFKAVCTRLIRQTGLTSFAWQPDYWDYVPRQHTDSPEKELHAIRRYIRNNPPNWDDDEDNPS